MRKKFFNFFSLSLFVAATFSGNVNANLKENLNKKNNAESAVFKECHDLFKQAQYYVRGMVTNGDLDGGIRLMVEKDGAIWKYQSIPIQKKCGYARVGTLNKNYTFDICDAKRKPIFEYSCKSRRKNFKTTRRTNYFEIDGEKLTRYFQYKGDETETGSYRKVK